MRDAIAAAHRTLAAVGGEVALALATGKLRASQLKAWAEQLQAAAGELKKVQEELDAR